MTEAVIILLWLSSLFGVRRHSKDVLHPFFWTNFMFLLYAVSFTYIYVMNVSGAKFLELAGVYHLSEEQILYAATACLMGKVAVEAVGPWMRTKLSRPLEIPIKQSVPLFLARALAGAAFAVGFTYWVYVMLVVNGGSLNIFRNIGVWEYVIADAGLTILPYHLVFAASHLWFLSCVFPSNSSNVKTPLKSFAFYPFSVLISLTTGRLSASILLLFVPMLAFYFIRLGHVPLRKLRGIIVLGGVFIVSMYFYRSYTSFIYIDRPEDFLFSDRSLLSEVLFQVIGSGNVPDPQQIILIQMAMERGAIPLQFGSSYFDWAYNLLRLGPTRSVGYLVHGVYFPLKSGGPTPGMIGEAIVNFGPFFIFPLVIIGYLAVKFYFFARKSQSGFVRLVYCIFLMNFWALFVKVDSSLIGGFLWAFIPLSLLWFCLRLVQLGGGSAGGNDVVRRERQKIVSLRRGSSALIETSNASTPSSISSARSPV